MVVKSSSHSFPLTKSSGVKFSFLTVWAASFISWDIIVQLIFTRSNSFTSTNLITESYLFSWFYIVIVQRNCLLAVVGKLFTTNYTIHFLQLNEFFLIIVSVVQWGCKAQDYLYTFCAVNMQGHSEMPIQSMPYTCIVFIRLQAILCDRCWHLSQTFAQCEICWASSQLSLFLIQLN